MTNEIKDPHIADHMANERTFLAWIRTGLGIIAFGFVIERFGLFIRQMSLLLGKAAIQSPSLKHGYSEIIGIFIVAFGTLMCFLAFINFKNVEKRIAQGSPSYKSGSIYSILITAIVLMGVFLIIYLIQNFIPGTHS